MRDARLSATLFCVVILSGCHRTKTYTPPPPVIQRTGNEVHYGSVGDLCTQIGGGEGYCSQDPHSLDLPDNTFVLTLPWRKNAEYLGVNGQRFLDEQCEGLLAQCRAAAWRGGHSPHLSLPPPEEEGVIEGELHIQWDSGVKETPGRVLQPPAEPEETPEQTLRMQVGGNQKQYTQRMRSRETPYALTPAKRPLLNTPTPPPGKTPAAGPAPPMKSAEKASRDRQRAKDFCELIDPAANPDPKIVAACKKLK